MSPGKSLRARVAGNTIAGWLNHITAAGSTLVFTPLIIHGFGSSAYGAWLMIAQLCGYMSILDLGVQSAVSKTISRARATDDREEIEGLLSTALGLHSLLAITGFVILVSLSPVLVGFVSFDEVPRGSAWTALLLASLAAAFNLPAGVFGAALKGYLRIDLVSWLAILAIAVRGLVLVCGLLLDAGLVGLAWAALAANLVGGIGAAVLFFRQTQCRLQLTLSSSLLRGLISFGLYAVLGTLGWYLAYASDAVVIGMVLTAADVARFGIASTAVVLLSGMVGAFSGSFLPLSSEMEARADLDALRRLYLDGTKITLVIGLPCVVVLLLYGPELLSLWVGPDLGRSSGRFLGILALAYIPAMGNAVGFQIALAGC